MKNFTIFGFAIAFFALSANAVAQETSATVETTANVLTPIKVVGGTALSFGDILKPAAEGTVTVSPDGTRDASAPDLVIAGTPGTVTAASFNVTGEPDYTYSITIPTTAFNITNAADATSVMSVGTFTSNPTAGTLSSTGAQTVNVGATLTVPTTVTAGVYSNASALKVTVNYN